MWLCGVTVGGFCFVLFFFTQMKRNSIAKIHTGQLQVAWQGKNKPSTKQHTVGAFRLPTLRLMSMLCPPQTVISTLSIRTRQQFSPRELRNLPLLVKTELVSSESSITQRGLLHDCGLFGDRVEVRRTRPIDR